MSWQDLFIEDLGYALVNERNKKPKVNINPNSFWGRKTPNIIDGYSPDKLTAPASYKICQYLKNEGFDI